MPLKDLQKLFIHFTKIVRLKNLDVHVYGKYSYHSKPLVCLTAAELSAGCLSSRTMTPCLLTEVFVWVRSGRRESSGSCSGELSPSSPPVCVLPFSLPPICLSSVCCLSVSPLSLSPLSLFFPKTLHWVIWAYNEVWYDPVKIQTHDDCVAL